MLTKVTIEFDAIQFEALQHALKVSVMQAQSMLTDIQSQAQQQLEAEKKVTSFERKNVDR